MEKYIVRALKTMNYMFLRYVSDKTNLDGIMKEELRLFFEEIAESGMIDSEFFNMIKIEMDKGGYLDDVSLGEYMDKMADAIGDIMGEVNETIYNLYTYVAGTLVEEKC